MRNQPQNIEEEMFQLCAGNFVCDVENLDFDKELPTEDCELWEGVQYLCHEDVHNLISNAVDGVRTFLQRHLKAKEIQLTLDLQPQRGLGSFIVPYNLLSLDIFHKLVNKLELTDFHFEGRKCTGKSPFFDVIGELESIPTYKIMVSWDLETVSVEKEFVSGNTDTKQGS